MSRRTRYAVVLGSGLTADGSASPVTRLRALTAAELMRKKRRMKLILSGSRALNDSGEHNRTEAEVMAEIVRASGVGAKRLSLEDQSFDTFGNAILTARRYLAQARPGTLFVVTSPFHMERALFIFAQVLGPSWKVVPFAAPEWSGETRQGGAAAAMERARDFFSDIEPGDIDACYEKLTRRIPAYKDRLAVA